jgi:hypothetical protein
VKQQGRAVVVVDAGLVVLFFLAALSLPSVASRHARPALVNLGPNDSEYLQGFREDWERDGRTRFHWTLLWSSIRLPIRAIGSGHVLRMRARRHFVDPAVVTLRAEGRTATRFSIQADERVPYRVFEFPLPELEGRDPFVLGIESSVAGARPLGLAVDWIEIARRGPESRFAVLPGFRLALAAVAIVAFLAPRLLGARRAVSTAHATLVLATAAIGTWWDVIAAERILRLGAGPYVGIALVAVLVLSTPRLRTAIGVSLGSIAGGLALVVLAAAAARLVLLLHPQFYYPDVKVHALFAWQLARRGLVAFLRDFTANQYRYSLGLQMENGHWYAFPYPPVFYLLTWPLVRLAGLRPEVGVSVLAAAVNSLEALVVFAIARRLGRRDGCALGAAAALVVLPLFIRRLSLAYFPAIVGHAVDAFVILYLLSRLEVLDRPRVVLSLGALIAAALLTYTQSLLNFGILLPLFVAVLMTADRSRQGRRRAAGLVVAGALGAVLSLVLFYGRYVPVFLDMRRGVPMAEETILLEKPASPADAVDKTAVPEVPDDPYAGPNLDLVRGVRKAAWRLYVFYGLFALAVIAGLVLIWRRAPATVPPFVVAWALTYLMCNLASGGLPGPNLVRYNKDLEIVAPLFCTALAVIGEWLWARSRVLAVAYAGAYAALGAARLVADLTGRFVLDR